MIAVALSGGVDSAAAAALLARGGEELIGFTLRLPGWGMLEANSCCCLDEARRTAEILGFPWRRLEIAADFERLVVEPFCREYAAGRTPNPCVVCNRVVKFGLLLEAARAAGAGRLATGHYARLAPGAAGTPRLRRGRDRRRDQSYFLYDLDAGQLAAALFPLGERTKEEARTLAREAGLPAHARAASQDVCFLGDADLGSFLAARQPAAARPGPIRDSGGRTLGTHRGLVHYTVGQRTGLGVAAGHPLYVLELDAAGQALVVGPRAELRRRGLVASRVRWHAGAPPAFPARLAVQVRYRQPEVAATVREGPGAGEVEVEYDEPQPAAAPGQAVVFYRDDLVEGGGTIERNLPRV